MTRLIFTFFLLLYSFSVKTNFDFFRSVFTEFKGNEVWMLWIQHGFFRICIFWENFLQRTSFRSREILSWNISPKFRFWKFSITYLIVNFWKSGACSLCFMKNTCILFLSFFWWNFLLLCYKQRYIFQKYSSEIVRHLP